MRIWIDTDNAAFEEAPEQEVARILRKLATLLENQGLPQSSDDWGGLFDINGNRVGGYCHCPSTLKFHWPTGR